MEILLCICNSTLEIDFDIDTNEHFVECFECGYTRSDISREHLIKECINDGCLKDN